MTDWKLISGTRGYMLSPEGEALSPSGKLLKLNMLSGYDSYSVVMEDGRRKHISVSKLMRETYPFEWIKYLEDGEEAKQVPDYPGFYITNRGRMWSDYRWKWLSNCFHNHPPYYYWRVSWGERGRMTASNIHTLVGRVFLPEYSEGLLILHKNETLSYPEINYVENLYVGTYTDNNRDAVSKNRHSGNKMRDETGRYIKNMV